MLVNLATGTFVIILTILVHTFGLIAVTHVMATLVDRFRMHGRRSKVVAMLSVSIGAFMVLSAQVWIWAIAYLLLGVLPDFETALYFSAVTFSTIGYGDVVPEPHWRMMAALEGINGLLMIGWSTAYLIAAGIRFGPFRTGVHF
jgi:hypothetical protein